MRNHERNLAVTFRRTVKRGIKIIIGPVKAFILRVRLSFGLQPLSELWGHDRGLPLYRYYTEKFLRKYSEDIRGDCLEFQEDSYTTRFAKGKIKKVSILHKESGNSKADIIADLTKENSIGSNQFDCIICTFVLHVIPDLERFISEICRILKPGGVLLIVVPSICMSGVAPKEYWRFTQEGLKLVLSKSFSEESIALESYGNSLAAAGAIRALVTKEFRESELEYQDKRFSLIVCARAIKKK